jgi:hypothetical protein
MRGAGSQSSASFVIRSRVKPCSWLRRRGVRRRQKHVWRARIVLITADGVGTNAIMRQTGKS